MTDPTRVKADIVPYTPDYAATVRSWIDSEETFRAVCGQGEYPPPDDLIESWQTEQRTSHLLFSHSRPIAFAQLWDHPLEMAVEIEHLVVKPDMRNQGVGSRMLILLYEFSSRWRGLAKVIAHVPQDNPAALACCIKAGFSMEGMSSFKNSIRMLRLVDRRR